MHVYEKNAHMLKKKNRVVCMKKKCVKKIMHEKKKSNQRLDVKMAKPATLATFNKKPRLKQHLGTKAVGIMTTF